MNGKENSESRLNNFSKRVERYVIRTLIALMSVLLIIATIQLAYEVVVAIVSAKGFLIDLAGILNLFGIFLLVLIGIELLDTIKVYFKKHIIHVEVVLLVAIIAIARKVIVMDFEKYTGLETIGIAAIVLALSTGYFLIKKTGGCGFWSDEIIEKEVSPTVSKPASVKTRHNLIVDNKLKGSPAEPDLSRSGLAEPEPVRQPRTRKVRNTKNRSEDNS